ncbi:MAG: hypothetical protein ACK4XK_00400 [Casimicrobiaceae bacterium]
MALDPVRLATRASLMRDSELPWSAKHHIQPADQAGDAADREHHPDGLTVDCLGQPHFNLFDLPLQPTFNLLDLLLQPAFDFLDLSPYRFDLKA